MNRFPQWLDFVQSSKYVLIIISRSIPEEREIQFKIFIILYWLKNVQVIFLGLYWDCKEILKIMEIWMQCIKLLEFLALSGPYSWPVSLKLSFGHHDVHPPCVQRSPWCPSFYSNWRFYERLQQVRLRREAKFRFSLNSSQVSDLRISVFCISSSHLSPAACPSHPNLRKMRIFRWHFSKIQQISFWEGTGSKKFPSFRFIGIIKRRAQAGDVSIKRQAGLLTEITSFTEWIKFNIIKINFTHITNGRQIY